MTLFIAQQSDASRQLQISEGVRIGRIVEINTQGVVFVDFPGNTNGPVAARVSGSIRSGLETQQISIFSQVLIAFENNDSQKPVVMDSVDSAVDVRRHDQELAFQVDKPQHITVDGRTMTFDAREKITLRCGKASITLTQSGRIIIRGAHVLSRSSGVNRIQGGSVRIN